MWGFLLEMFAVAVCDFRVDFWCYNFAKYKRISSALFKVGASNRLQKLHVEIACVNRPDVLQNISLLGHEPNPITSNIIGLFIL